MPTTHQKAQVLDTSHYQNRRSRELSDATFEQHYRQARAEIAQVDAVMRQLDSLREDAGMSKAELARMIGKNPSVVRRLFTAEVNPELKTIAAIASALGARLEIISEKPGSTNCDDAPYAIA
ncbi:MAG: helix-turn-helix transcriptional regulator [Actinobacteria bacterium]|jgi:ribosome-binding protein aMBF1 (putative translation factor)|nr:helix-turn-helix transcriptional regulator [Actinomycetota bacterium]